MRVRSLIFDRLLARYMGRAHFAAKMRRGADARVKTPQARTRSSARAENVRETNRAGVWAQALAPLARQSGAKRADTSDKPVTSHW
jgi:hypothetical protein